MCQLVVLLTDLCHFDCYCYTEEKQQNAWQKYIHNLKKEEASLLQASLGRTAVVTWHVADFVMRVCLSCPGGSSPTKNGYYNYRH